jgi:large subunit ribosomal protein L29
MRVSEIRAMSMAGAERQVAELRSELAKEKAVAASGTRPENPGKIRAMRRNIARFLTVINEKARAGEKAGQAEKAKPKKAEGRNAGETKDPAKNPEKKSASGRKARAVKAGKKAKSNAKRVKKRASGKKTKKKREVKKR